MTKDEKNSVTALRKMGCSYSMIAKKLQLSVSAVKCYCQRNGLRLTKSES